MKYPKEIMRKSDLIKMGFPEELLDRAYRCRGQAFAQKIDPSKKNSPLIFDTAGFERWRLDQIKAEQQSMRMREGVI
ncbi:hypothetical protein LI221_05485 [Faecalimonas umbilicata]|nr:hypothetical protein [Faecalimonas umbilicata]